MAGNVLNESSAGCLFLEIASRSSGFESDRDNLCPPYPFSRMVAVGLPPTSKGAD
jgi:hypothetical protein